MAIIYEQVRLPLSIDSFNFHSAAGSSLQPFCHHIAQLL
jgi:hypothetical protein